MIIYPDTWCFWIADAFSTPVTNEHWPLMHWNFPIGFQDPLLMAKPNSEFWWSNPRFCWSNHDICCFKSILLKLDLILSWKNINSGNHAIISVKSIVLSIKLVNFSGFESPLFGSTNGPQPGSHLPDVFAFTIAIGFNTDSDTCWRQGMEMMEMLMEDEWVEDLRCRWDWDMGLGFRSYIYRIFIHIDGIRLGLGYRLWIRYG